MIRVRSDLFRTVARVLVLLAVLMAGSDSVQAQDKSAKERERIHQERVAALQTLVNQGNQAFLGERYAEAESNYMTALESKEPSLPKEQVLIVYQNLAHACYRQEHWADAIEAYRLGQAEDSLQLIAQCHIQLGNLIEAEHALRGVLVLFPGRVAIKQQLAKLVDVLGRDEEAAEMYRQLLVEDPLDLDLYRLLGACYIATNRNEDAIDVLELAWRLGERGPAAARLLGDLYLGQDMKHEAADFYRKHMASSDELDAVDCFRLGFTYYQNNENVSARAFFSRAVELDASYANAFLYLGHTAAREKNVDLALREFRTALEHDGALVAAHEAIGSIELGRGELKAAIVSFENAVEHGGAEFSTHYNLIQTQLRLDQRAAGISALKRAFREYPARPELRVLLDALKRSPLDS